jgi:transposase-like protein
VEVDHVTVYRWAVRFTPLLADAARPCRHQVGDRRQLDETYAKVSVRRDANAARRFFQRAIGATKITLA